MTIEYPSMVIQRRRYKKNGSPHGLPLVKQINQSDPLETLLDLGKDKPTHNIVSPLHGIVLA